MISAIRASQRLDSRGNPTVQVRVETSKGSFEAIVPSGASKGAYEAVELRDGDPKAYHGQGVQNAITNVEKIIAPELLARNFDVATDLHKIDRFMVEMDGTDDKSKLGANAILGISMACARAGAAEKDIPLYEHIRQISGIKQHYVMPVPFFNVLNGGVHSGNLMSFQEFMIAPLGAESFSEAVRLGSEVYQELKSIIKTKYGSTAISVGDEGGFAPPVSKPSEALDLLVTAVENCGYTGKIKFGIDPASEEFLKDGLYDMSFKEQVSKGDNALPAAKLGELYQELLATYPVILLEDPFGQDD